MSEDIADIIFEGLPKEKRYPMIVICAIAKEIICGGCNPEYVKKKMTVILIELKKIWNNKS